ncbi:hypothetical protein, partial [Bradyrhizobium sp. 145]|uniref:hypothetical protein n=1 Tax=Bradyrhizobium sp. 145 TaxID=2782621 RepID=UPI001FF7EB57
IIVCHHKVSTYFGGHLMHQSTQKQKVQGNSRLPLMHSAGEVDVGRLVFGPLHPMHFEVVDNGGGKPKSPPPIFGQPAVMAARADEFEDHAPPAVACRRGGRARRRLVAERAAARSSHRRRSGALLRVAPAQGAALLTWRA